MTVYQRTGDLAPDHASRYCNTYINIMMPDENNQDSMSASNISATFCPESVGMIKSLSLIADIHLFQVF
jgi:hypothetical protein